MESVLIFAIGASVAGAIFLVSLVELYLTVRRRKAKEGLEKKLQDLKAAYSQTVSSFENEKSGEVQKREVLQKELEEKFAAEKAVLESSLSGAVEKAEAKASEALKKAKEKARELESQAQLKAEEYLEKRRDEVEKDLQDMVLKVTKQVLPEGLTYEVHRDLIVAALREAKLTGGSRGKQGK